MDLSKYVEHRKAETPQSKPVPGKDMVANAAGGFVFELDKWAKLDRFLVLGTEGGSYYVSERELTEMNFKTLDQCLAEDPVRTIDRAVELSVSGRAPKNDPALFVLAKASADKRYPPAAQYALRKLPEVARIGTHLFHFVQYANSFRGWGRALKKGVARWYDSKTVQELAYQAAKYKQRDGWSHRDLLRLSHPKATDSARNVLYGKITHPEVALEPSEDKGLEFYRAAEQTSIATDAELTANLVRAHNIPRECINTQLLNDKRVWAALLEKMPLGALLRNLGKLSSLGMTERYGEDAKQIVEKLTRGDALKKARLHPVVILGALNVYAQGRGVMGSLTWQPNREIVEALNDAFYLAFDHIEPTNKRYLLGLDVSGSMYGGSVIGIAGLNPATASAAMAMATLRVEQDAMIKGFTAANGGSFWRAASSGQGMDGFIDLNISKRTLLDQVVDEMRKLPMGATDCALPMLWATKHKVPIDVFCVYTDNDTWAGTVHPFKALKAYRQAMGIPAKLVVLGTSSNDVSIADPSDAGMLDVAGFDSAVPQIISDFARQ